ncbi:hypothetical protein NQZ68_022256 [Dissostichus eleginoides]|nr:hypothetical protein NQZ68_022256 [Dissostichus eleginoides]
MHLLKAFSSETYGPVMIVYLGWQWTVVLVGYDAVKEALVDHADDFTGRAKPFDPSFLLSLSVSNVICCLVFGQHFEDQKFLSLLQIILDTLKFGSSPWGQV